MRPWLSLIPSPMKHHVSCVNELFRSGSDFLFRLKWKPEAQVLSCCCVSMIEMCGIAWGLWLFGTAPLQCWVGICCRLQLCASEAATGLMQGYRALPGLTEEHGYQTGVRTWLGFFFLDLQNKLPKVLYVLLLAPGRFRNHVFTWWDTSLKSGLPCLLLPSFFPCLTSLKSMEIYLQTLGFKYFFYQLKTRGISC